jgi:glycerophosphoryl diester phosphodiesterase
VEVVEAIGVEDEVVFMSLSLSGVRELQRLRPDWTVGLLSSVAVGDASRLNVDFLALNARTSSRHLIRQLHGQGKKIMVWTINDPVGISSMVSRGVDMIITDEPAMAVALLQEYAELDPSERLLMQLADLFDKPWLVRGQ